MMDTYAYTAFESCCSLVILYFYVYLEEIKPPVVKLENGENTEDEAANEDGKQPSFCVLLHGSLRVESMVAVCQLG